MALLNIFRGTQTEVSERPVSDGALLFATDTKKIYLDKGSDRIEMSSVQDLSDYVTTSELEELLATKADAEHTHANATGDASGFMSSADKTKLDGLVGLPEGGTTGQVLTKTADGEAWQDAGSSIDLPLPISQGGTGVTTEDALVQLVFNSASTPQASDIQYGVVKFASDEDFKAYMGIL